MEKSLLSNWKKTETIQHWDFTDVFDSMGFLVIEFLWMFECNAILNSYHHTFFNILKILMVHTSSLIVRYGA